MKQGENGYLIDCSNSPSVGGIGIKIKKKGGESDESKSYLSGYREKGDAT